MPGSRGDMFCALIQRKLRGATNVLQLAHSHSRTPLTGLRCLDNVESSCYCFHKWGDNISLPPRKLVLCVQVRSHLRHRAVWLVVVGGLLFESGTVHGDHVVA
jgi:hypothetical protein